MNNNLYEKYHQSKRLIWNTYLLTYLRTYLLTCLLTYLLTCLLTYLLLTYLLTYLLAYLLTYYLLTCLFTYLLAYLLITYLLAYLLITYLLAYLLTYLLITCLLAYLLTYLLAYLLITYLLAYLFTYLLAYLLITYLLAYLLTHYLLTCLLTYLFTYSLTHSMQQSHSWEANQFSSSQKIPGFYGTRRFITAFTSARHLSLSGANSIQSINPHPTFWRSSLILSSHLHLGLPSGLFPSGFPTKTLYTPLLSPTRTVCPVLLILLDFIARIIRSNREERDLRPNGLNKHRELVEKQSSYLKRRTDGFGYYPWFYARLWEKWILSRKTQRHEASKLIHVMQNQLRLSVHNISVVKWAKINGSKIRTVESLRMYLVRNHYALKVIPVLFTRLS